MTCVGSTGGWPCPAGWTSTRNARWQRSDRACRSHSGGVRGPSKRDIASFKQGAAVLEIGTFSEPDALGDVRNLTLDAVAAPLGLTMLLRDGSSDAAGTYILYTNRPRVDAFGAPRRSNPGGTPPHRRRARA
jgi:hypothetical protein